MQRKVAYRGAWQRLAPDHSVCAVVLFWCVLALTARAAGAGTVFRVGPTDCSSAAVNLALARAASGDTIELTCTGTVSWSSSVTLSGGKTLKGPGSKGERGLDGSWPLTINVALTGSAALIDVVNRDNEPANRITGLAFEGTGAPYWIIRVTGRGTGPGGAGAFRIDNNFFNQVRYTSRLTLTDGSAGKLTGLVDHNVLYYRERRPTETTHTRTVTGAQALAALGSTLSTGRPDSEQTISYSGNETTCTTVS